MENQLTFGDIHIGFIDKNNSPTERKDATAVFLIGFINGLLITGRNERGWDIPGGHVESTDLNLFSALQRETLEESGVILKTATPYAILKFDSRDDVMLFYTSKDCILDEFIPKEDAFEMKLMAIPEFIEKYYGKKNIMELLINKALDII
ncbi:MAG: NUDIX domain-containing protein [bacterium]|nr:NUDIX domain-containing protein [bacterium]